jgi:dehydrogenase/reductase SDR family member 7B
MAIISNQVVWLTGASSGIGEALAYALAKEGAKLIISARRPDELQRVATKCKLPPDKLLILPLDLTDESTFEAKKAEVLKKFGRIDILINNGGISQRSLARDTSVAVDRSIMEVNYFGTVALTKTLLPDFRAQKSGLYVVVSSAVGKFGSPWRSGYSASKHALHGFFDSLRAEEYDSGIRVLIVCPGFIQTNISMNALTGGGQKLGSMDSATSKGLTADECARQIIQAIQSDKEEIVVAKFRERFAVIAKRFFPGLFSRLIRGMAVR